MRNIGACSDSQVPSPSPRLVDGTGGEVLERENTLCAVMQSRKSTHPEHLLAFIVYDLLEKNSH